MKYQVEDTIHHFHFWGGAKDTIEELTADEMDSLEQLIEEMFCDSDELPTDTDINDFVWFERDTIAQHLGYDDFDELMHRNDEPDLPNEFMVDPYNIDSDWDDLEEQEKEEAISDYLSDEYEYCHNGFRYEEAENGCILIYDIQWDTED